MYLYQTSRYSTIHAGFFAIGDCFDPQRAPALKQVTGYNIHCRIAHSAYNVHVFLARAYIFSLVVYKVSRRFSNAYGDCLSSCADLIWGKSEAEGSSTDTVQPPLT